MQKCAEIATCVGSRIFRRPPRFSDFREFPGISAISVHPKNGSKIGKLRQMLFILSRNVKCEKCTAGQKVARGISRGDKNRKITYFTTPTRVLHKLWISWIFCPRANFRKIRKNRVFRKFVILSPAHDRNAKMSIAAAREIRENSARRGARCAETQPVSWGQIFYMSRFSWFSAIFASRKKVSKNR